MVFFSVEVNSDESISYHFPFKSHMHAKGFPSHFLSKFCGSVFVLCLLFSLLSINLVFCADSHNNDQVGKSVAIIVGVFGGLAVLVVLLSICKKAAGKHFTKKIVILVMKILPPILYI